MPGCSRSSGTCRREILRQASRRRRSRSRCCATRPGSIIIAHANGRGYHTAAALPLAIPKLKALGYEFVTVSELLAAGRPVVASTCYDSRPGDTDRYDRLLQVSRAPARSGPAP